MQGCVQGYGNYEELTSSGVNPTELFDDVEDSSNLLMNDITVPDIIVEECDGLNQVTHISRSQDQLHLLPVEKARRRVNANLSGSTPNLSVEHAKSDEGSLYTTPSLHSLISVHDNLNMKRLQTEVSFLAIARSLCNGGALYLRRTFTMQYQKRRELTELYPTRLTSLTSEKGGTCF